MMFRRLYWVVEEVAQTGHSQVTGVYTSIQDLVKHGLAGVDAGNEIRLTLTKLDSSKPPLGCWASPRFENIEEDMKQYILTDEFTEEQCKMLSERLHQMYKVSV
ncbi:MAG: hypothetical protein J0H02_08170 [Armatimonadetes bacterium]|nr:hypothetical protein [Armatimonadota bacterium]